MIDRFIHGFLNRVYDEDDYTQQEINSKLIQKIDEVIENCNSAFEFLDWIKGQGLTDEVINTLLAWKDDGTLEEIINERIFSELQENGDIVEDYDITFENSWTNYNSSGTERSKINYKNNVVNINFKIKSGDITNGTKICSIDSKYTPTRDVYTPCFVSDDEQVELQGFAYINKNGEVIINGVDTNSLLTFEFNYLK